MAPTKIENQYNELFNKNNLLSYIMNQFTDLLENFAGSGRYYYTSKDTRKATDLVIIMMNIIYI